MFPQVDKFVADLNPYYGIRLLRMISDVAYTMGLGQIVFSKELVYALTGTEQDALSFAEPVQWRKNICERFIRRYLPSAVIDGVPGTKNGGAVQDERAGRLLAEYHHVSEVVVNSDLFEWISGVVPIDSFLNLKDQAVFSGLEMPKTGNLERASDGDSRHFREGRRKAERHLSQSETPGIPKLLGFLDEEASLIHFWLLFLEEEIRGLRKRDEILDYFHQVAGQSQTMSGQDSAIEFNQDNFYKTLNRIGYPVWGKRAR